MIFVKVISGNFNFFFNLRTLFGPNSSTEQHEEIYCYYVLYTFLILCEKSNLGILVTAA